MGCAARKRCTQYGQHARDADGGAGQARQGPRQSRRLRQRLSAQQRRRIVEATYFDALSPARPDGARQRDRACHRQSGRYLDRRPEPAGDALLGVADHRHSGKECLSPHVPSRRRLRPQRQRPASRAGDLHRQPEPRHAHPSVVDARGRLRRHDLSLHGRRAPARGARCRRLADRDRSAGPPWTRKPLAPSRPSTRPRATTRPIIASRPTARRFHIPVGTRRGVGAAGARFLSRELHGRARPRRRQGPVSLSPRADLAHQPSLQGRHDQGARHGRGDVGLGHAAAARHGARDRARGTRRRGRRPRHHQRAGPYRLDQQAGRGAPAARRRCA